MQLSIMARPGQPRAGSCFSLCVGSFAVFFSLAIISSSTTTMTITITILIISTIITNAINLGLPWTLQGPITAIRWRGGLVAWVNSKGVKVVDVETYQKATLPGNDMERDKIYTGDTEKMVEFESELWGRVVHKQKVQAQAGRRYLAKSPAPVCPAVSRSVISHGRTGRSPAASAGSAMMRFSLAGSRRIHPIVGCTCSILFCSRSSAQL